MSVGGTKGTGVGLAALEEGSECTISHGGTGPCQAGLAGSVRMWLLS